MNTVTLKAFTENAIEEGIKSVAVAVTVGGVNHYCDVQIIEIANETLLLTVEVED